jgi:hypothetical protein
MLTGICSRRLPTQYQQQVSIPARTAGSSLSCAFPLQSHARHRRASTHACGAPSCLVPGSWPSPFSLGGWEGRRGVVSAWTRRP